VGVAAPTPPFSAALGLTFSRLATAGNETFAGRRYGGGGLADDSLPRVTKFLAGGSCRWWELPLPLPRFLLRSAYLAGDSLSWATKATTEVASNFPRRCTDVVAVGKLASDDKLAYTASPTTFFYRPRALHPPTPSHGNELARHLQQSHRDVVSKRRISPACACLCTCVNSFFTVLHWRPFTARQLVLVVSVHFGEHKGGHLEVAWPGRSLATCL
jgi:hypothetical protein